MTRFPLVDEARRLPLPSKSNVSDIARCPSDSLTTVGMGLECEPEADLLTPLRPSVESAFARRPFTIPVTGRDLGGSLPARTPRPRVLCEFLAFSGARLEAAGSGLMGLTAGAAAMPVRLAGRVGSAAFSFAGTLDGPDMSSDAFRLRVVAGCVACGRGNLDCRSKRQM